MLKAYTKSGIHRLYTQTILAYDSNQNGIVAFYYRRRIDLERIKQQ